jgi:trigger factor
VQGETTNRLLDALVTRFEFPVPESLVQQQIDARLDRGLRALASQGMRTEDMRNLDFDRLRAAQRPSATAEVKGSILLDRIADAENVTCRKKMLKMNCRLSPCKCASRWMHCARV